MADQDEGPPRPRPAGAHDTESSRIKDVENQTFVDWGSCESLTSDGYLRGSENRT